MRIKLEIFGLFALTSHIWRPRSHQLIPYIGPSWWWHHGDSFLIWFVWKAWMSSGESGCLNLGMGAAYTLQLTVFADIRGGENFIACVLVQRRRGRVSPYFDRYRTAIVIRRRRRNRGCSHVVTCVEALLRLLSGNAE